MPSASREQQPPLRLLALHGGRQTGLLFSSRIERLTAKLASVGASVTFADGPHTCTSDPELRAWCTAEREGLAASLVVIEQAWCDDGPFDGIIGFSQGALAAAAVAARPERFAGLRFAILAGAPLSPNPAEWGLDELTLPCPVASLHLFSA